MGMPRAHDRVRGEVLRLVHRGLPVPDFSREVGAVLCRAVPAEGRQIADRLKPTPCRTT